MNDQTHEGFKLLRREEVPLLQATFYESEHISTGARHIHFACDETMNVFASIIPTVPTDETGAPHILEHCVLSGGSKHYPDARSLGNLRLSGGGAWTGWEYTWYTFSGRYREDFVKRIDSQLDFLFEPLLSEETFWHQAHHLEFEDPEDPSTPLRIRGVIFNEQKGIFSMPLYVSWTELGRGLLPGLPYALEHGGGARTTPEITWEQLKEFHRNHYHPSNAYFISWGDTPVGEIQQAMDVALTRIPERPFEPIPFPPLQRFTEPRRHVGRLPIAAGEDPTGRGMLLMGWVTGRAIDSYEFLLHDMIADLLIGTPSAPLRQALASSGLGKRMVETFDSLGVRYRDLVFSTGLADADPAAADEFESLVMETLKKVVRDGFSSAALDAATNRQEFRRRLQQSSQGGEGSPTALFIEIVNTTWVNGGDPLRQISIEGDLARFDRERESGRPIEEHIQKWFIDNPHRALVILEPDPGADVRMEEEERERLAELKARLTDAEKQEIIDRTRRLRAYQEARSKLPEMPKSEAAKPAKPPALEPVRMKLSDVDVESYAVRTNGITYIDLLFDIGAIPDDLWDYMAIFAAAMPRAGVDGRSADEMTAFIAARTGGISAEAMVPVDGSGESHRRLLRLGGRALERRQNDLVDALSSLLREAVFTPDLVRAVVASTLAQAEQGVFTQATNYLRRLAGSHVRESWALRERIQGFAHLDLLRRLQAADETTIGEVTEKLSAIRSLAARGALDVFVAASSEEVIAALEPDLRDALDSLPGGGTRRGAFEDRKPAQTARNEARTIGMPAAFNCEALAVPGQDNPDAVALLVSSGLAGRHVSIEVVRKGTAYHAGCDASSDGGSLMSWSVRDPHIARTYRVFEESRRRLREEPIDESELSAILRSLSSLGELTEDSLRRARRLFMEPRTGVDPDRIERYREALAKVTIEEIRRVADEHLSGQGARATLASGDLLDAAKKDGAEFSIIRPA